MKSYGTIKVGDEEISITEVSRIEFKDKRFITIAETEKESYVVMIENLASSGRNPKQHLHLTRESFISLFSAIMIHMEMKGENIEDLINECVSDEKVFRFESSLKNTEL